MEKVRFGIIGVGNMGSGHAKSFLEGKVDNGVLAAICDLKPEKIEKIRLRLVMQDGQWYLDSFSG